MFRLLIMVFLAAPTVAATEAQTVYKTVEDGVPTFSDTPPADGAADVLTLDVPPPADDALLETRLSAMRESTERMAEDRREREKHRAALRSLNTPAPAPAETPIREQPATVWAGGYWPAYGFPARPRPPYRPHRPRPTPLPIAEPPPGWSVIQPGNAQLMRPRVYRRK